MSVRKWSKILFSRRVSKQVAEFVMQSPLSLLVVVMLGSSVPAHAAEPEAPKKDLPLAGKVFSVAGRTAFLIPAKADPTKKTRPWVWYAPTLPNLPAKEEKWMFEKFLEAGISVAGIDAGESYGSPRGNKLFTAFHSEMTDSLGYSAKPVLLGRSRGGLMTLSWAAANPDKVAGFAGIYPVCNLASYPGVAKAAGEYAMKPEELQAKLKEFNPVDRLAPLAKAGVPLFAIHGDVDKLVPLDANSGLMKERYAALGGRMELMVPKGQGHNMWSGFFQCQELVNFVANCCSPGVALQSPLNYQVVQRSTKEKGTIAIRGHCSDSNGMPVTIEARLAIEGQREHAAKWVEIVTPWLEQQFR